MHPILRTVDHRPWPVPQGPWIMTQTWNDLLFAHWPLPPEVLRQRVPAARSDLGDTAQPRDLDGDEMDAGSPVTQLTILVLPPSPDRAVTSPSVLPGVRQ